MTWAIKCVSDSPLDGHREYFAGAAGVVKPREVSGCRWLLFRTRDAARDYIKSRYGYIAKRKDLREPPHCWRMPQAVKVEVILRERL